MNYVTSNVWKAAFEPHEDGYVYFKSRWSPGVPVSKEEHDGLVSGQLGFPAFQAAIKGRAAVVPPRSKTDASSARQQMVKGIVISPTRLVMTGLPTTLVGLVADAGWPHTLLLTLGIAQLLLAALLFIVRRARN